MRSILILILVVGVQLMPFAQETAYKIAGIGFYNFENLFDTLDAPDIRDEEFTPQGDKLYGTAIYTEKMDHLATVVSQIGTEITPDGLALLGVSEIENRKVLEDFVAHPKVADRNYEIVHYDSPDRRGIDVALLYQPKYYTILGSQALPVMLYNDDGSRRYTRDVLHVSGLLDGDTVHVLVNHWPSRSGGEKVSQPSRNAAAAVCKQVVDSLCQRNPNTKVLIMGDLNDDPISPSVKEVLNAQRKTNKVRECGLFNPMWDMYRKGFGTLAYRDAWSLFDQIIVSKGLLKGETDGYFFHQANVYKKRFMLQKTGRFKGYPFRTFAGDSYLGGYSDHFPVYVFLLKEVEG
jgi:predicted extracellular nuclease